MKRILLLAPVFAALPAQAHPGHEPLSLGLGHFAQSPSHFLPAIALSAILMTGAQLLKVRAERNLLRAVAGIVLIAVMVS